MAPTRWKSIERPVTASNAASVSTASLTSFTMSSVAATFDVEPGSPGRCLGPEVVPVQQHHVPHAAASRDGRRCWLRTRPIR